MVVNFLEHETLEMVFAWHLSKSFIMIFLLRCYLQIEISKR